MLETSQSSDGSTDVDVFQCVHGIDLLPAGIRTSAYESPSATRAMRTGITMSQSISEKGDRWLEIYTMKAILESCMASELCRNEINREECGS
jgi:hypothetical protein